VANLRYEYYMYLNGMVTNSSTVLKDENPQEITVDVLRPTEYL
jgi:hypothetical protein